VELKVDGEQTRQRVAAVAGRLGAGPRSAQPEAVPGAAGAAWTECRGGREKRQGVTRLVAELDPPSAPLARPSR
jgi:hypothetical protein